MALLSGVNDQIPPFPEHFTIPFLDGGAEGPARSRKEGLVSTPRGLGSNPRALGRGVHSRGPAQVFPAEWLGCFLSRAGLLNSGTVNIWGRVALC